MEQDRMSKRKHAPVKARQYLVARGREVLGTYTTRRIAVAVAEEKKGTLYGIESVENCVVTLAQDRSFEEVA